MNKMKLVGWVLLILTGLSITLEIAGAIRNDDSPDTWTEQIVNWVPWELSLAVYGALVVWLPFHFYVNYKRKHRKSNEQGSESSSL